MKVYNWQWYVDIVIYIFRFNIFVYYTLIFVRPCCNVTVPLVQHYVIKNGTLNGFLYYNIAWLSSITISTTFRSWSNQFTFSRILSLLICVWFCWCINSQPALCFIGRIISQTNNIWPGIQPFNLFVVDRIENAAAYKMPDHGSSSST